VEEAIATGSNGCRNPHEVYQELAFFTAVIESQSLTGLLGCSIRNPEFRRTWRFCSVNMAAARMYTLAATFWEFGSPTGCTTSVLHKFGFARIMIQPDQKSR